MCFDEWNVNKQLLRFYKISSYVIYKFKSRPRPERALFVTSIEAEFACNA